MPFCIFQRIISMYHFHSPRKKPIAFFLFLKDERSYKIKNPNFLNINMKLLTQTSVFPQSNDLGLFYAYSRNNTAINIIFINSFSRQPVNYTWKSILLSYMCSNNGNKINYHTYSPCWALNDSGLFTKFESTFRKVEDLLEFKIFHKKGFFKHCSKKWWVPNICFFSFSYPLTSLLSVENITM